MTETRSTNETSETADPLRTKLQRVGLVSYVLSLTLLSGVLLVSRTEIARLVSDGPLLLLFLLLSVVAEGLGFSLSADVETSLASLFDGAALLILGFNGVWVRSLSNLFWLFRRPRPEWEDQPTPARLMHHLFNLSLNTLPPWLGLFVYHNALQGDVPLTALGPNLLPALAFVLVQWVATPLGVLPVLLATQGSISGVVQWFKETLAGLALSFLVPMLFSVAVAIILNRLGLGFFLFVTLGLLGVSLMAQRLARSLASERQRVRELTTLNALGDDLLRRPPDLEVTGELLVQHAPQLVPDASFELTLFDPAHPERRHVLASWGDSAAQSDSYKKLTSPWAWLQEQCQVLHLPDLEKRPPPFRWEEADGPRPGALLLVPLLVADPATPEAERCIGGLRLSRAHRHDFEPVLPSVTALANQLAAALENARLYQAALARERLERELVLAREIQTSFLPADVPRVPGWAFAASLAPARHVSGDFYDFIPLPGDRWGLLIADVADKGMPAALYMALTRTLIRAHAQDFAAEPARCLQAVNGQILTDTQADSFVTVFYGILDPATGELCFTSAGHNPPYLCRRNGADPEPLRTAGMPLGILPEIELGQARARLSPGDYLVLYTDGVTEAHDVERDEFGEARLLAALPRRGHVAAESVHARIQSAVRAFVGEAPQFDDLTLVVVGWETALG